MAAYTFFRFKLNGKAPSFEIADFDQDDWAISYGRSILARAPRYTSVEVFKGEANVAVLSPDGLTTSGDHRPPPPHVSA
jgi:hypothetical protein